MAQTPTSFMTVLINICRSFCQFLQSSNPCQISFTALHIRENSYHLLGIIKPLHTKQHR